MPHTVEIASSGRSKCRGCGARIDKGELRFGERLPNVFADGEMTLWFHPICAAYRRPEALCALVAEGTPEVPTEDGNAIDWPALEAIAKLGVEHPRLQRVATTQRAKTGRASCRHCREAIGKDSLRIALQYFEDARFTPSGFLHPGCATAYVGTPRVVEAVARAGTDLSPQELDLLLCDIATDVSIDARDGVVAD